ncbi:MAG: LamG domain-containing protein [Methylophagaceae bacterium]
MANTRVTNPVTGFNSATEEGLKLPSGTNANLPTGVQGMIRNDTDETGGDSSVTAIEHHNGTTWKYFAATESADPPTPQMYLDASNTTSYPPPQTGATWFDLTSNANNGTISGAQWFDGYFDFDGVDDYVNVPDNNSLEWTTSKSLSVWVNSNNSSGNKGIVAKTTNASPYGWILQQDGGTVKFWFASGANFPTTPATTLPLNTWTHIAVTYNGSSLLMYKNDVLVSTLSTSLTPALSSSPLTIGRYYSNVSNYYFNGQMSKVRIYDVVLTQTEITALKNEGR